MLETDLIVHAAVSASVVGAGLIGKEYNFNLCRHLQKLSHDDQRWNCVLKITISTAQVAFSLGVLASLKICSLQCIKKLLYS